MSNRKKSVTQGLQYKDEGYTRLKNDGTQEKEKRQRSKFKNIGLTKANFINLRALRRKTPNQETSEVTGMANESNTSSCTDGWKTDGTNYWSLVKSKQKRTEKAITLIQKIGSGHKKARGFGRASFLRPGV